MQVANHMLLTGRRGLSFEFRMALRDLRQSYDRIGLAWALGRHDVVSRYRGSILGPFWITISMGLMVLGIGFLYAQLFQIEVRDFMPHVALGIVFFGMISTIVTEGCDTFILAKHMLSHTALPMFTFLWRTIIRNLLNLAHHMLIIVAVMVFYDHWRLANVPVALLGLVLLVLNASWISLLAAILSARFRDIPPIVASVMQFAMFMTPVFWTAERFPDRHFLLVLNPFNHMLDVVRAPLLGKATDPVSWMLLIGLAAVGWLLTFAIFAITRRRIVHYL
jgi:ABC-type polysaccharide/polyol phosphate export permease